MGKVKVSGSPRKTAISSRRRKSLKQNSFLRQAVSDALNFKYLKLFTTFASSIMPVLNSAKELPHHDQSTHEEKEIDVGEDDGISRLQINFIGRKSRRLTDQFSLNQEEGGDIIADSDSHLSRRKSRRLSKRYSHSHQGEARRDILNLSINGDGNLSMDGIGHISSWNSTPKTGLTITMHKFQQAKVACDESLLSTIPESCPRPSKIPRRTPSKNTPPLPSRYLDQRNSKSRIPRPIPFQSISEIGKIPIPEQDVPMLKSINPISKPSFKKHDHSKCLRRKSSVLSAGLQQALLKGKSSNKLKKGTF